MSKAFALWQHNNICNTNHEIVMFGPLAQFHSFIDGFITDVIIPLVALFIACLKYIQIAPGSRCGVPESESPQYTSPDESVFRNGIQVWFTMSGINPLDHLAIANVLSRYCQALDLKDFDLLNKVFLPDVVADYPFNSDLNGVDAVKNAIQNR
jgi:hypothetical protein